MTGPGPNAYGGAAMFDRIARRYDVANRLLSLRRDVVWRRRLSRALPLRDGLAVLDLATGTADVLVELRRAGGPVRSAVGLDVAGGMLAVGQRKLAQRGGAGPCRLVRGDAAHPPFGPATFDAVTIAFGIRNMPDVPAVLDAIHQVLKPEGRALILEFSLPAARAVRALYRAYLRHVLPRLGGLVAGDTEAYRYLNRSIEAFPHGEAFCQMLTTAGFANVSATPLTGGVATLYAADRP